MREAAVPDYKLSKSRRSTRVLITLGLIGLLLGLLSAAVLSALKTGVSPAHVLSYYRGDQTPDDSLGALLSSSARPLAELAEVTHLHLTGGTMLLFFLCHLLSLCSVSERLRVTLYVSSFVSFLLTFGSPWLIVYVHPLASYIYGPSLILFIACLAVTATIPIYEMWFKSTR